MSRDEIEQRIRGEVLGERFPELLDTVPVYSSGPSEKELRRLRRTRGAVPDAERALLRVEHSFAYQRHGGEDGVDSTVVIVTDDDGAVQAVIESR